MQLNDTTNETGLMQYTRWLTETNTTSYTANDLKRPA